MSKNSKLVDDEINLSELSGALWAHKTLIFACTFLAIVYAGYYFISAEKKVTARAIFQIEQKNNSGFNLTGEIGAIASLAGLSSGNALQSESTALLERLESREFILNLTDKLSLDFDTYFSTYGPDYKESPLKVSIKKILGLQKTKEKQVVRESLKDVITIGNGHSAGCVCRSSCASHTS